MSPKRTAIRSLRDIRPPSTVAERRPIVLVALLVAAAGLVLPGVSRSGSAGRHDKAVPILMYHVIAAPPAGVPFPDLFVRPADFGAQMKWLPPHGYEAVAVRLVFGHFPT